MENIFEEIEGSEFEKTLNNLIQACSKKPEILDEMKSNNKFVKEVLKAARASSIEELTEIEYNLEQLLFLYGISDSLSDEEYLKHLEGELKMNLAIVDYIETKLLEEFL